MPKYTLYIDAKKIADGVLSVDQRGEARFYSGNGDCAGKLVADLERVKLEFAAANGISLSGFEWTGKTSKGIKVYRYREWWLVYYAEKT